MKYGIVKTSAVGGPYMAATNIVKMLHRHADFEYEVFEDQQLSDLFKNPRSDILLHILYTVPFLQKAAVQNIPVIAGPNIVWKDAASLVRQSDNIRRILTLRPDPAPRKCNPSWSDRISFFPPFVDEEFFVPKRRKKTIDVLTIDKAFRYPKYQNNLNTLTSLLRKTGLNHVHLRRYNLEQLRDKLSQSKVIAFPSPKESGVCCCHALLEANMMNVPFIVLDKLITKREDEFDKCRGIGVSSIKKMAQELPDFVRDYGSYNPREWVVERYSFRLAHERLKKIIELSGGFA